MWYLEEWSESWKKDTANVRQEEKIRGRMGRVRGGHSVGGYDECIIYLYKNAKLRPNVL